MILLALLLALAQFHICLLCDYFPREIACMPPSDHTAPLSMII
jgi:hypothetical protein